MTESRFAFTPSPDVAAILNVLLDIYERRKWPSPLPPADKQSPPLPKSGKGRTVRRAIRCDVQAMVLPGYHSQVDPEPRQVANEQLVRLEQQGYVKLAWLPGQEGHLLASVSLLPERARELFAWLGRTPVAAQRARLRDLLLGERFRFVEAGDWRLRAVQHTLAQLKASKSPAPFSLDDEEHNRDLLAALVALDDVAEETPYRVFSVRVFNDSKRFESLKRPLAALARQGQPDWSHLSGAETLRELGLVANPGHLYLYGAWRLVDEAGAVLSLGEFHPSVGVPSIQAARIRRVEVDAARVVCVENQTTFYELVRHEGEGLAAVCLWGNPSPACRHLLRCLAGKLPQDVPLLVWADIDYGGLRILAHLRDKISPRFEPYHMDIATLEAHATWGKPLTHSDERNLRRLAGHPLLTEMRPLIEYLLARRLKLEQEAVAFNPRPG